MDAFSRLRHEARAMPENELTAAQGLALAQLRDIIAGLARSAGNEAATRRREEPRVGAAVGFLRGVLRRVAEEPSTGRQAMTVLIDGARGSGKTTVLSTALHGWQDALFARMEGPAEPLGAGGYDVVPLRVLDLMRVGPKADLLMLLLSRFLDVTEELAASQGDGARVGDPVQEAWRALARSAVSWRAGDPPVRDADLELVAWELEEQVSGSKELQTRFRDFVDQLSAEYRRRVGCPPFWIIPIDDGDLSPSRTHELLLLLRVLYHPSVALVMTGNHSLFRHALTAEFRRDLGLSGGPQDDGHLDWYTRRLAQDVLRRVLPPAQVLDLGSARGLSSANLDLDLARRLRLPDALKVSIGGEGPATILDLLHYDGKAGPAAGFRTVFRFPRTLRRLQDLSIVLGAARAALEANLTGAPAAESRHAYAAYLVTLLAELRREVFLGAVDAASRREIALDPEGVRGQLDAWIEPESDGPGPVDLVVRRAAAFVKEDPPGFGDAAADGVLSGQVQLTWCPPGVRRVSGVAEADPDVNADALSYWTFLNDLAAAGFPGLRLSDRPPSVSRDVWFVCGRLQLDGKVLHLPWQIPDWPDLRREDNLRRAWQEQLRRLPQGGAGGTKWQDEWANGVWDIFRIAVGLADREVPTERWRQWWGEKPGEPEEEGGRPSGSVEWKAWEVVAAVHAAPEYGLGESVAAHLLSGTSRLDRARLVEFRRRLLDRGLSRSLGRAASLSEVLGVEAALRDHAGDHPWHVVVDRAPTPPSRQALAKLSQRVVLPSWAADQGIEEPYRSEAFGTVRGSYFGSKHRLRLFESAPQAFHDELDRLSPEALDAVAVVRLIEDILVDSGESGAHTLELGVGRVRRRLSHEVVVRDPTASPRPLATGWEAVRELHARLAADVSADRESERSPNTFRGDWPGIRITIPAGLNGDRLWFWPSPEWPALIDHELTWDAWAGLPNTEALELLAQNLLHIVYEVGQQRRVEPAEPNWDSLCQRVFRKSDRVYRGWRWEAFDQWRDRLVLLAAPWAQLTESTAKLILDTWLNAPCRAGLSPAERWSRVKLREEDRQGLVQQIEQQPDHPFSVAAGPYFPASTA